MEGGSSAASGYVNPGAPSDVVQSIRDQNAAFWASVGAPFETSNGQIVATPDFSPGFSAAPFTDPGFNGT